MEYIIYTLSNPNTNEIFYVGCTSLSLKKRLENHYRKLYEARSGKINWCKRLLYLNELLIEKAHINEIERCSFKIKDEREKYHIEKFRKHHNLTNQTTGGQGGDTFSMLNDEQKAIASKLISEKNKNKSKPKGFAEALSKARKGYGNPQAGKTSKPPIVLENVDFILIFRNGIESNSYFGNRYCWGNLVACANSNLIKPGSRKYLRTYDVNFSNSETNIKDIVESLLERQGNSYVYDKHTQKVRIK